MLDSLRKLGKSIFGKILMAFLMVGLAGFGISNVLTTIGSDTVARVGGKDITIRDFQRAYSRQLDAAAQQYGVTPTAEQALQMGIPSVVLNTLAANAALGTLGDRMGLGASDDRLGKMLRQDPSFSGAPGQFSRALFQQVLRQVGYTEAEYLNTLKDGATRQQVISATLANSGLPKVALDLIGRYSSDRRIVSFYALGPDNVIAPPAPTEEELQAYLKDNQQSYRTTPTRTAKFMVLSLDALAATITVGEDEIAAEYERTKANLTVPERRAIVQVVLTPEQQTAFETGKAAGKGFDAFIAEAGLTTTDLGTLAKSEISDTNLAEAAFGMAEGEFALVPGALGMRAVRVSKITPEGVKSLDEVRADIEKSLKIKAAKDQFADVLDQIEELRAAFKPLDEIAARFKLTVTEVALTASGTELAAIVDLPAESDAKVATTVFATEMGALAPSVTFGSNLSVWFDLQSITDARDQTLDEVRDAIGKTMTDARIEAALKKAAEEDVKAIEGGMPFDLAATSRGTFAAPSEAFSRAGLEKSAIDQSVAAAAFRGPENIVGQARNAAGQYVVFKVTKVEPSEAPLSAETETYIASSWRDNLYGALVTSLRNDIGLTVNENKLSQLVGLPTGN